MKLTILGCGASSGVPVIGCDCATCTSNNPKNKRLRASVTVEYDDGFTVLVDTSPDLRTQVLTNNIRRVDAVIFTHAHADHLHGIDDLRAFNKMLDAPIPAYFTKDCYDEIRQRFAYVFDEHEPGAYWSRANITPHVMEEGQVITLPNGHQVQTFIQGHGSRTSLGLRFGDVVYSTDFNHIPTASEPYLQDMKIWILDCLRDDFAGSHNSLEQALNWVKMFAPKRAILTHMNHELEYEALKKRLPSSVSPAFDGLVI